MPYSDVGDERVYAARLRNRAGIYVCGPLLLRSFGPYKNSKKSVNDVFGTLARDGDDVVKASRANLPAAERDSDEAAALPKECGWISSRLALHWMTKYISHDETAAAVAALYPAHPESDAGSGSDNDGDDAGEAKEEKGAAHVRHAVATMDTRCFPKLLLRLPDKALLARCTELLGGAFGSHGRADVAAALVMKFVTGRAPNISSDQLASYSAQPLLRARERHGPVWDEMGLRVGRARGEHATSPVAADTPSSQVSVVTPALLSPLLAPPAGAGADAAEAEELDFFADNDNPAGAAAERKEDKKAAAPAHAGSMSQLFSGLASLKVCACLAD